MWVPQDADANTYRQVRSGSNGVRAVFHHELRRLRDRAKRWGHSDSRKGNGSEFARNFLVDLADGLESVAGRELHHVQVNTYVTE